MAKDLKPVYIDTAGGGLREQRSNDDVKTPLKTQNTKTPTEIQNENYDPGETVADSTNNRLLDWMKRGLVGMHETGKKLNKVADLEGEEPKWFERLLNNTPKRDVLGYLHDSSGGGGSFTYDPGRSRQEHNGGTIISPTWSNGVFANPQDKPWFNPDPNDNGNGCWVRSVLDTLHASWWGVKTKGENVDNSIPINALIQHLYSKNPQGTGRPKIQFGAGDIVIKNDIIIDQNDILLCGKGERNTYILPESNSSIVVKDTAGNWTLENFIINGQGINDIGIRVEGANFGKIDCVRAIDFAQDGILVTGDHWTTEYTNITASNNGRNGISFFIEDMNAVIVNRGKFNSNGGAGIELRANKSMRGVKIKNAQFERNETSQINISKGGDCRGISIIDPYIEMTSDTQRGILIKSGSTSWVTFQIKGLLIVGGFIKGSGDNGHYPIEIDTTVHNVDSIRGLIQGMGLKRCPPDGGILINGNLTRIMCIENAVRSIGGNFLVDDYIKNTNGGTGMLMENINGELRLNAPSGWKLQLNGTRLLTERQPEIPKMTDNTGGSNGYVLPQITGTGDDNKLNNIVARLNYRINDITTRLENHGLVEENNI